MLRPAFGWADGCTSVKISGHGFGDSVSATIGGNAVTDIVRPDNADDQTFYFFANTPPGTAGDADVVVTSDGKDSTILTPYYYVECPGSPYLESVSDDSAVSNGETITLGGCNIDASTMTVQLVDKTGGHATVTASLTSDCSTAFASFTAPDLPDGDYYLQIEDNHGDVVYPATGDYATCRQTYPLDSAGVDCDKPWTITYGGAR